MRNLLFFLQESTNEVEMLTQGSPFGSQNQWQLSGLFDIFVSLLPTDKSVKKQHRAYIDKFGAS